MIRYFVALPIAVLVTLALFWVMQWLIVPKGGIERNEIVQSLVEFVRVKHEPRAAEEKKRILPKQKPKEMPKMNTKVATSTDVTTPQPVAMDVSMPSIKSSIGFANGPKLTIPAMSVDSDLIALVRINPQYPMRARQRKIEGYVKMRVYVGTDGKTKKVEIIEANPPKIFNRAAIRALYRWKFKPKTVGGKPVEQTGILQIDFNMKK